MMTELEGKVLKFYLRHVGVVASDEDFGAWYMQRYLGGRLWPKVCHFGLSVGRRCSGRNWCRWAPLAEFVEAYSAWQVVQVQCLLDALAAHNRHQARTAVLIMWRSGLRVAEVLELECRDLDYSGEPLTLLVRKSKSRRARTVRLHRELV